MITKVKGRNPQIAQTAFVHISAVVIGDVVLKEHASVWPCAVLRGDMSQIIIGENSNVQDNSVLHTNADMPLVVGDHVVIAHGANLHSCEIGENSIVGIGAIVLDGAKIGKNSLVAAGSLVPPNKEFPDGSMIMGSPAKVVRPLEQKDLDYQKELVAYYAKEAQEYRETEQL